MITYIKIDGITCNSCKETIKKSLLKIKNIKKVEFNKSVAVVESKMLLYNWCETNSIKKKT